MMSSVRTRLCLGLALAVAGSGCDGFGLGPSGPAELAVDFSDEELGRVLFRSPLPDPPVDTTNRWHGDADAARFGQALFYDTRLSGTDEFSCASCHDPDVGFGDENALSNTIAPTGRHAPQLWNVAYQRWYFWDGRIDSLWAQALGPVENPIEMGNDRLALLHTVHDEGDLRADYEAIFGSLPPLDDTARFPAHARPIAGDVEDPLNVAWEAMSEADRDAVNRAYSNLGKAIAAYEAKLIAKSSRFDIFVEGIRENDQSKVDALTAEEQRGLQLFVGDAHCFLCHLGPQFSDKEFHNIGLDGGGAVDYGRYLGVDQLLRSPFNALGPYSDDRAGEKARNIEFLVVTPETQAAFKTPGLRNVALSAPFMHDGRFETLADVVHFYNVLEEVPPVGHREDSLVPLELSADDEAALVAFLESLTDVDFDEGLLGPPAD